MRIRKSFLAALAATALLSTSVLAGENPAGEPVEINGMKVAGVYLQPVEMEPAMAGQEAAKTDIHLETDIHALKGNENGFAAGEWIPYLAISYQLTKKGSAWKSAGPLLPMIASDGPHYGANVKLDGPGQYALSFHISPPHGHVFMRHTDKETGVGPWWQPFDYQGEFKFVGTGKKGGY